MPLSVCRVLCLKPRSVLPSQSFEKGSESPRCATRYGSCWLLGERIRGPDEKNLPPTFQISTGGVGGIGWAPWRREGG